MTLMPHCCSAVKIAAAVPGTPCSPVPSTLIMCTSSIVANPLTGRSSASAACASMPQIAVPGAERWKKLRSTTGMPRVWAGSVVRGWRTEAPK